MNTSTQLDAFAPAFVAAQAKMGNPGKVAQNPHFRNRYADLAEVVNTVTDALNENGIGVLQSPGSLVGNAIRVTTRLLHKSGQFIEDTVEMPISKMDAQGAGSAITYARRYALAAMCGVAQEDDDGEGAVGRAKKGAAPESAPAPATEPKSPPVGTGALLAQINEATSTAGLRKKLAEWKAAYPEDALMPVVGAVTAKMKELGEAEGAAKKGATK